MDFLKLKAITIPEGNVIKLVCGDVILWQRLLSRLPKEYQELAYLSADVNSGAYFDLGFAFDTACKVEMLQYVAPETRGTTSYPFGAAENSGVLRCMISSPYDGDIYGYGSNGSKYLPVAVSYASGDENEIVLGLKQGELSLKNLTTGKSLEYTTQTSYTMTSNLYLFAQNYNGSMRYGRWRKLGYFKYYDKNNELICDLIPCYRKIDNKIGMYNVAKKQFFKNIGEGEFTAGHTDRYVNLLPWATDTNGTIYNGVGYKDTTRLSSSGGGKETSAAKVEMCASGFIPAKVGDVVRIKGSLPVESIASYLMTYDYNKTFIKHNQFIQSSSSDGNYWGAVGVTWFTYENDTLTIPLTEENFGTGITYFRFSMHMDENTIVTVNQEIPITNLAEPLPNNTTDTSKWVNGYRFSSSAITAQEGTTLSNHIFCKKGDVIRIKGVDLRGSADRFYVYVPDHGIDLQYWNVGSNFWTCEVVDGVYVVTITDYGAVERFRFAMPTPTDPSQVIVTVNEEIPNNHANMLPYATDTDETIYNSVGYAENMYLSSGVPVSRSGIDCTGFIPIGCGSSKTASGEQIVRMKGVTATNDTNFRIALFSADETLIQQFTGSQFDSNGYNMPIPYKTDASGNIVEFDLTSISAYLRDTASKGELAYIRICCPNIDSNSVITVNREITTETQPEEEIFNNWVPYSTEDDDITIYNNGLGYKDGYRVRSGGGEAENKYATATGYIPVKAGDVVRVKGAEFLHSGTENAINVYDESFAVLGQMAGNSSYGYGIFTEEAYANYQFSSVVENPEGVFTWVVPPHADIRYMRVTARTNYTGDGTLHGDGLVVTVNELLIPSIYQQVEWLRAEANTATYINLGFSFDTKAKIYMENTIVDKTTVSYTFGAAESNGKLRCMLTAPYSETGVSLFGSTGSTYHETTFQYTENVMNHWEMILEPGNLQLTDLIRGTTSSKDIQGSYTMTSDLYLFAQNYNGTVRYGGSRQVGKFQYYDKNGFLICDLVPCYRKTDGVAGMYDLVRDLFLTNVGTGADFTKGPDVNQSSSLTNLLDMSSRTIYTGYSTEYIETTATHEMDCTKVYATGPDNRRGTYATSKFSDFTVTENSFSASCSSSSGYRLEFPINVVAGKTYKFTVTNAGGYYVKLMKYNSDTTLNNADTNLATVAGTNTATFTAESGYKYSISFPFGSGTRSYTDISLIEQ